MSASTNHSGKVARYLTHQKTGHARHQGIGKRFFQSICPASCSLCSCMPACFETVFLVSCRTSFWPFWWRRSPSSSPPAPPRSLPCWPGPSRTSLMCARSSRQHSATSSASSHAQPHQPTLPGMLSWLMCHGAIASCPLLVSQHCYPLRVG